MPPSGLLEGLTLFTDVLLRYTDLFPAPGSTLTGHTDAVEHEIDTSNSIPIRCAPHRMSPRKMKKECVNDMLTKKDEEGRGYPVLC